jgi:hypothetical protein
MNILEFHFLHLLQWHCAVSADEYDRYRAMIESVNLSEAQPK